MPIKERDLNCLTVDVRGGGGQEGFLKEETFFFFFFAIQVLRCSVWSFSSRGIRGLLLAVAWAPERRSSVAVERRFSCPVICGICSSLWTRD